MVVAEAVIDTEVIQEPEQENIEVPQILSIPYEEAAQQLELQEITFKEAETAFASPVLEQRVIEPVASVITTEREDVSVEETVDKFFVVAPEIVQTPSIEITHAEEVRIQVAVTNQEPVIEPVVAVEPVMISVKAPTVVVETTSEPVVRELEKKEEASAYTPVVEITTSSEPIDEVISVQSEGKDEIVMPESHTADPPGEVQQREAPASNSSVTEILTNVVQFFRPEGENGEVQAKEEEATTLTIVESETKIVLSARKKETERREEPGMTETPEPIVTADELEEVFTFIAGLSIEASLEKGVPQDKTGEQENDSSKEVEVVVSEELLEFMVLLKDFTDPLANEKQADLQKREKEETRAITFLTTDEESRQLVVDQEQVAERQLLVSILKEDDTPEVEEPEMEMVSAEPDPIREELTAIIHTMKEKREDLPVEPILEVSVEVFEVVEKGVALIEAFEKLELKTDGEKQQEFDEDEEEAEQYITLFTGEKEITVEVRRLQTILKLHTKKQQRKRLIIRTEYEGAPEEILPSALLFQQKFTPPSFTYQTLQLFVSLIDQQLFDYEQAATFSYYAA